MNITDARNMLASAGVFFGTIDDPSDPEYDSNDPDNNPKWNQTINLNDVWGWAISDCQYVSNEELPEVGNLFFKYGWCGILYWCKKKAGIKKSEFYDVNRFIEFVENEEKINKELTDSTRRAYTPKHYTIGTTLKSRIKNIFK